MAAKKKPGKKHRVDSRNKPSGHCCWVCGQHKANEKFSGRGNATHMCRQCHALPVAERNKMVAVRRAENMAFRYLSEQEINWLRKKMDDPRPEVREAARDAHNMKFPRYERNKAKKGLTTFSLELFIKGKIRGEWGDVFDIHSLVVMVHNSAICHMNYCAPENERDTEVIIDTKDARAFIKAVIHRLDALYWDEDLSDAEQGGYDPYLDILPECRPAYGYFDDDDEVFDEYFDASSNDSALGTETGVCASKEGREAIWTLRLELNNGKEKKLAFYNQMHDEPQALYWELMEWLEPDEYDFEDIDEDLSDISEFSQ